MAKRKQSGLTTPDLVLLSLLAERPMHGYQANLELERREVKHWAGVSRPQVYYSLDKLAEAGLIRASRDKTAAAGPERRVFLTTAKGKQALARALADDRWTTQRERPPFLTWLSLSWQAEPDVFSKQLRDRRKFLERELRHDRAVLRGVLEETGHEYHEAVWMLKLFIDQFRTELRWLKKLEAEAAHRAPARHPALVEAWRSKDDMD